MRYRRALLKFIRFWALCLGLDVCLTLAVRPICSSNQPTPVGEEEECVCRKAAKNCLATEEEEAPREAGEGGGAIKQVNE